MKCRSSKRIVQLHVKTYSAVAGQAECKLLPGNSTMFHYVRVENLYAWDAEISFQGVISNRPPLIKFASQPAHVDDDDAHWHATVVIADGQDAVINHVRLLPTVANTLGQTNIILKLSIIWSNIDDPWRLTMPGSGSVSICVTR